MINDTRDLNESYQYFKKKYKEKWKKKEETDVKPDKLMFSFARFLTNEYEQTGIRINSN